MKTSSGLILTDGELILLGKNSNEFYDIPKGNQELNETYLETCIREVKEETNLDISNEILIDLGLFKYTNKKNLYLFLLKIPTNNLPNNFKCNSSFINEHGKEVLEFLEFKYVKIEELKYYIRPNLLKVIEKIFLKNT